MKNWYKKGSKKYDDYKHYCIRPKKYKIKDTKGINKYQIDARTLHNKMPYIWRFLDRKTMKKNDNFRKATY